MSLGPRKVMLTLWLRLLLTIKMNDTEVEKEIKVVKRTIPTFFLNVDLIEIAEVFIAEEYVDSTEGPTWFEPMWDYLAKKGYCHKTRMKKEYQRQAHRYAILANRLYRRCFWGVLMRCVLKKQGEKIMREVYGGGED